MSPATSAGPSFSTVVNMHPFLIFTFYSSTGGTFPLGGCMPALISYSAPAIIKVTVYQCLISCTICTVCILFTYIYFLYVSKKSNKRFAIPERESGTYLLIWISYSTVLQWLLYK